MLEEVWKDIEGYVGYYQISNLGRVKSLSRKDSLGHNLKEMILKPCLNKGYYHVNLYENSKRKTYQVHQLVAVAFLNHKADKFKIVINHKDENPLNNNIDNLELCTHRYNIVYSKKNETGFTGVNKIGDKYMARIRIDGKHKYLGIFYTAELASEAYRKAYHEIESKQLFNDNEYKQHTI